MPTLHDCQLDTGEPVSTSLVLGSGGARGLAHIGVIRCLIDRGLDIRYVAGSSIGAMVGGIYACGQLDVYTDWVTSLQRSDIVRLLDWSFDRGALFKGDRIINVLKELVGERNIEDLPMGFTAVATDLSSPGRGREVWLNHGPLFDAIRASMSVPTVFAPVATRGRLLIDGGVVNPVPVAPTLNDHTEITIAVDLLGTPSQPAIEAPAEGKPGPNAVQVAYRRSIGRYLDRIWADREPARERLNVADIAMRSMETMQAAITQFKLAATAPSVVVRIPRNVCGFFDFHRGAELIEVGYAQTARVLDSLELTNRFVERPGE